MSTQYYLSGTASTRKDTKRVRWDKILTACQKREGSKPNNNPHPHNTVRQLKSKTLKSINGL